MNHENLTETETTETLSFCYWFRRDCFRSLHSSSPKPLKEDKLIGEIGHPAEPLYFAPESLQIPRMYISTSEAKRSALRG